MQVFELEVPGLYSLRTTLPVHIDEEHMSCRPNTVLSILVNQYSCYIHAYDGIIRLDCTGIFIYNMRPQCALFQV